MSRTGRVALGVVGAVVLAVVVIVAWPAPDPLKEADTVYVRFAGSESQGDADQAHEGLVFALGTRDLTIVSDPTFADVLLEVQDVRVNLGDIELSLTEGRFQGRMAAECLLTDMSSGKQYTMDLSVRIDSQGVTAELKGRRFWVFWK